MAGAENYSSAASLAASVEAAAARIEGHLLRTAMQHSPYLSERSGCSCYLKMESEQVTGSFKARGATNKVLGLQADDPRLAAGLYTASTGNHALAMTHALGAARSSGLIPPSTPATIFVSEKTAPSKIANLQMVGAPIEILGDDAEQVETHARDTAAERGGVFVSPYNDLDIIAGQGTIGLEMLEQLPDIGAVFVAAGGGGLIAGIAGYVKHHKPSCQVIGCSAEMSACLELSVLAGGEDFLTEGEFVNEKTLSDGTAGGIEAGAVTLPICKAHVDDWVSVSEEEIGDAVYDVLKNHHKLIEGAAGVAVAGMMRLAPQYQGQELCAIVCGNNIGVDTVAEIIAARQEAKL
jgi:threonine dehydratase